MATNKPALLPFRYGTVKREIPIGSYAFTLGQSIPTVIIPQVGMLAKLNFKVSMGYTGATAPLVIKLLDGFDGLINRLRVGLNNGSANLVDLSGIGIRALNYTYGQARGKMPLKYGDGTLNAGFPLAIGAHTVEYNFSVPINANDRKQFEIGLINLQAPELRASVDVSFNQASSLFTVPGNFTQTSGSIAISYEYFEIPDPSVYAMPPLTIVRTIEDAPAAINAVGDQIYQIPRLGTMFDYTAHLVLNGVYAGVRANLDEFKIRYNKSDVQYDELIRDAELREAAVFGGGAYSSTGFLDDYALHFNLWAASDRPWNGGDFRDAIDTEENTTTEAIITVDAAAVLGAATNALYHTRRVVQRIVQSPSPASGSGA